MNETSVRYVSPSTTRNVVRIETAATRSGKNARKEAKTNASTIERSQPTDDRLDEHPWSFGRGARRELVEAGQSDLVSGSCLCKMTCAAVSSASDPKPFTGGVYTRAKVLFPLSVTKLLSPVTERSTNAKRRLGTAHARECGPDRVLIGPDASTRRHRCDENRWRLVPTVAVGPDDSRSRLVPGLARKREVEAQALRDLTGRSATEDEQHEPHADHDPPVIEDEDRNPPEQTSWRVGRFHHRSD